MPAAAAAAWTAPALVPGADGTPVVPSLDFSGSGVGLIATEFGKFQTAGSVVTADRPGPMHPISPRLRLFSEAFYSDTQVVGAGYERKHGRYSVKAAFGPATGPLNRVVTVASGLRTPSFALDANGRGTAAIVYNKDRGLYLRVWRAGRGFGRSVRVSGSQHALAPPAVKVNLHGDVLMAWNASEPPPRPGRPARQSLMARIRVANGRLDAIRRLGPPAPFQGISLDLNRSRRALVGWQSGFPQVSARVAYASRGGRWHDTEILESAPRGNTDLEPEPKIRVAFSSNGRAAAVWNNGPASSRTVRAALLEGNAFGPRQTLSGPAVNAYVDSLAAGSNGELVTTWSQGGPSAPVLFASTRTRTGHWGAAEPVATGGSASQVAISPLSQVPFAVFVTSRGVEYSTRTPVGG